MLGTATGRWIVLGLMATMAASACTQDISTNAEAKMGELYTLTGIDFELSNASVVHANEVRQILPGTEEQYSTLEFTNSDARLSAVSHVTTGVLKPMTGLDPPAGSGCVGGDSVRIELSPRIDSEFFSAAEKQFYRDAGLMSSAAVGIEWQSPSGITTDQPQRFLLSIYWYPEDFGEPELNQRKANGSDYASKVPTAEQVTVLLLDVFHSIQTAAGDGDGCASGTELTTGAVTDYLSGVIETAAAEQASQTVEPTGCAVAAPLIPVDSVNGFGIALDDGDWVREAESVIVSASVSLADLADDVLRSVEARLMAVTEEGRELCTEEDWAQAEGGIYTPNFVAVVHRGDDLVVQIDTKGIMSPEMRDAMIGVLGQELAARNLSGLRIVDEFG